MRQPQQPQIKMPENRYTLSDFGEVRVVNPAEPLHQVKIMLLYDGFMGALYPDPFRGRLILTLFQFEVRRGLLSLNQRSGIGFILQDTDNSSSGPFTVLAIRIAAFCMWHPIVPLICQRGEYAHPVQLVCDMGSAEPLQTLSENIPHHIGGIFVNFQALMLIHLTLYSRKS